MTDEQSSCFDHRLKKKGKPDVEENTYFQIYCGSFDEVIKTDYLNPVQFYAKFKTPFQLDSNLIFVLLNFSI